MGYVLAGDGHLWPMLGGVMLAFIGVALLSPLVGRPVVATLGQKLRIRYMNEGQMIHQHRTDLR